MPLTRWKNTKTTSAGKEPKVSILPNGLFIFNKATRETFNIPQDRNFVHLYQDKDSGLVVFEFVVNTTDEMPIKLHFNRTGMYFSARGFLNQLGHPMIKTTQFAITKHKSGGLMIYLGDNQPTQKKQLRRPMLNLKKMGIPVGAKLFYARDKSVVVKVISEHKVEYKDRIYSLSALSKTLLGRPYNTAPCKHWIYRGKKLSDIYNKTYPLH